MIRSRAGALALILLLAACTTPSPTPSEPEPEREPIRPVVSGSPSAAPAPSATPTTSATSGAEPTAEPLDTTGWITYVSEVYGFAIGHPPDWSVVPAARSWTMEVDAGNWDSLAQEGFLSADSNVAVVAWTAQHEGEQSFAGVHRWVDDYCSRPTRPCGTEHVSRVPLCSGQGFCHPGLLLPEEFPQAFFTGDDQGRRITVVASGRPSDWPITGYGDALQVFEAFLSTMGVCRRGDAEPRGCDSGTPLAGEATGDPLTTEGR